MDYDELMNKSEEGIEKPLLDALYPRLSPDAQKEIQAQHIIDYYDTPLTIPDFAFPDVKIAIYCDSYEYHWERDSFQKDRQQARELQLQGWCRPTLRGAGNPERDGRGSSHDRASDTAASAGTGESAATDADAKGKASAQWRIRSRIGRGGSVDDTGRVPFPHTVLSSDLWLLVPSPTNQTRNPPPLLWRRQRQRLPLDNPLQLRPFRLPIRPIYLQILNTPAQKTILLLEELRFKCNFGCDFPATFACESQWVLSHSPVARLDAR